MNAYEQLKSTLTASDGVRIEYDDAAQKINILPSAAASFVRRIGWHSNTSVTSAIVALSNPGQSETSTVVMPANSAQQSHVWVWMATTTDPLNKVVVSGLGDARLAFGPPSMLTVAGVAGKLWVTTDLQNVSDWAGKTVVLG